MRRNPGVTGDGWQLPTFRPGGPRQLHRCYLSWPRVKKTPRSLAAAGLIAFTAPRGAQSLPLADFTELAEPWPRQLDSLFFLCR